MAQYNLFSKAYFELVYDMESPQILAIKERIRDFIKSFGQS